MIARIALNPASFAEIDDGASAAGEIFARHKPICDALRAHGVLVLGSQHEVQEFKQAIHALAQRSDRAAVLWGQVVKALSAHGRVKRLSPEPEQSLEQIRDIEQLRRSLARQAELAVMTVAQAGDLGVVATEASHRDEISGIHVSPASRAANAEVLLRLQELRDDSLLPTGAPRERFNEVLGPIARASKELVIYDRYLFNRLATDARRHDEQPEHVAWLLEQIERAGGAAIRVRLMGAVHAQISDFPDSAQRAAELVRTAWRRAAAVRPMEVHVETVTNRSGLPHTRHLRSSLGLGITMEPGFDRLAQPKVRDREGIEWSYRFTERAITKLSDAELNLERDKSHRRIGV